FYNNYAAFRGRITIREKKLGEAIC
ncbi:hypothetical protein CP08DC60_1234B, partial [Chlamydia psittaci 08DC60]